MDLEIMVAKVCTNLAAFAAGFIVIVGFFG